MKKFFLCALCLSFTAAATAQLIIKEKKYPSLLWEISGKGLKKPSYLMGTMHVSNKLAFNLPDSFYIGIKNAQVVALETNPETWQEDMDKYEYENSNYNYNNQYADNNFPSGYLSIETLKFFPYYNKIERALFSNSSAINSLLYRTYGNTAADFEEDTYLDMYIFQCGKKLGKVVAGVENYGESMKLMAEAYQDAAKDKNKKRRMYVEGTQDYSIDKLQEAYRTGNLDLLDTINKFNSTSAAFDEKFLYKRNEIQANNIDSIIKTGKTLFVGVGAAHLPGQRGVIEMLRAMGYKVRPVKMGLRNSKEKDMVDKIRVPVKFATAKADDGMYTVDIPGKFYKTSEDLSIDQRQYADMSNGSYYTVSRTTTNAWLMGHDEARVLFVVDSLLYENVPGKIISKSAIIKNGYKGFDISNRTRRGDLQRSQIIVTPFEVLFFKMSGNADYVKNGDEANRFFNSIAIKEFGRKKTEMPEQWKLYSPPNGGFSVMLPHEPALTNDGSAIFDAIDKSTNTQLRVVRTDIHNYNFVEEDSFDLNLMEESFMASSFIESLISHKQTTHKGYPALDGKYRAKNGNIFTVRFIIQGPHYYSLVAHNKTENAAMQNFINSFEVTPFRYAVSKKQSDSALAFTVTTPVFPENKKIKLDMPAYSDYGYEGDTEDDDEKGYYNDAVYKSKIIVNDSTGEKIFVSMFKYAPYVYIKDSSLFDDKKKIELNGDSSYIVRLRKTDKWEDGTRVRETIISDTGSSRILWGKSFYKNGVYHLLNTQYDTLSAPSDFIRNFYQTFKPADTVKGHNPFERKTDLFFTDLAATDSAQRKKAIRQIDYIDIDSTDFTKLSNAVNALTWKQKNYLNIKSRLLSRFGDISTKKSADYLKQLYYASGDTVQLQYTILENLLQQKTAYAYSLFRDIVNNEPPVINIGDSYEPDNRYYRGAGYAYDNKSFFDELGDSLKLTKTILPDLLPLLNLDDYKIEMMELLRDMVDSSVVTATDYEVYFSKFMIEAKQELRKQAIAEKQKSIDDAEDSKKEKKEENPYAAKKDDKGNDDLSLYATLLLPFAGENNTVLPLLNQMLQSNDKRLKYNTLILLLKNKKNYPDSMIKYFAGMDEYRYELFADLKKLKKETVFPPLYKNHLDLAVSKLNYISETKKPDSIVYADRLSMTHKGKKGYIYFFKYKDDKEDLVWKIATVGLVPEDVKEIEFDEAAGGSDKYGYYNDNSVDFESYDFTEFSETVIKEEEQLKPQLQKQLKRMMYSRRKSAVRFYKAEGNGSGDDE